MLKALFAHQDAWSVVEASSIPEVSDAGVYRAPLPQVTLATNPSLSVYFQEVVDTLR